MWETGIRGRAEGGVQGQAGMEPQGRGLPLQQMNCYEGGNGGLILGGEQGALSPQSLLQVC